MTGLEPSLCFSAFVSGYIGARSGQAKNFLKPPATLVHSGFEPFALAPKDCGRSCG
ncbi:hypothetical protein METHPM2_1000021 [Pseudomonas sp. PM2]